jgi:hypothetical protein
LLGYGGLSFHLHPAKLARPFGVAELGVRSFKIHMRFTIFIFFAFISLAKAQIDPLPSFTLRFEASATDPLKDLSILKSPFFLVVKNGEAFLAESETPQKEQEKRKGTVDIIFRTGIEPATKTFKDPILQVVFHYDGPGWTSDRVLTDITVPMTFPKEGAKQPLMVFSDTAKLVSVWMTAKQGSLRTLADPMNVRMAQTLKCSTISSDLQPPQAR